MIGGSEYAYAYGVVSGMTAKLISPRTLDELTMFRSVEEVVAFLEGTDYEPDLREAIGKRIDTSLLERSLIRHFMRTYQDIVATLPPSDRKDLNRTMAGMFRTENLKIIMREVHSGMGKEETERMLYPVPDPAETEDLLGSKDLRDLVERLGDAPERVVLAERLDAYEESGDLMPLENAIDKWFLESWHEPASRDKVYFIPRLRKKPTIPPDLGYFIGVKTDVTNIKTLLRCGLSGIDPRDYVIKGGLHLGGKLDAVLNGDVGDVNEMLELLDATPYGPASREGVSEYQKTGSLAALESKLEGKFLSMLEEKYVFNPLSMLSIILFINQKWKEVRNLRTIVVCKGHEMEPAELRKVLVS